MTSALPTSQLSQELIDQILDHVAADSNSKRPAESLLQCALVSRSFRPRSQLHMFSSIDVGRKSKKRTRDEKIQGLLDLMQDNPSIVNYIEELSLECADYEYSWIYENQAFIDVMKIKSTAEKPLRKLTLQADKSDVDGFETFHLEDTESLRAIFFLPFIAPFITSLSIDRLLNLPVDLVTGCVNLVHLELLHVEWNEHDASESPGPDIIRLRSLKHRMSRSALDKLLAPTSNGSAAALDLSQLQSFTVYNDTFTDLDYEQKIIDGACKWLEEIYILTMDTPRGRVFHGSLDLRGATRLRRLHAHVLFPEDSLASIRQTLSTVRSGSLEDLFIDAKVGFWDDFPPETIFNADWAALCADVARVMVENAAIFEVKLTYLYRDKTTVTWNDELKARLGERCQSILVIVTGFHTRAGLGTGTLGYGSGSGLVGPPSTRTLGHGFGGFWVPRAGGHMLF